jgi:hypothetical protein
MRRSSGLACLVGAASICLATALPVSASADPQGAAERATRVEERLAQAEERRAARAQERAERLAARTQRHAERLAARAERQASRRSARNERTGEAPGSGKAPSETGAEPEGGRSAGPAGGGGRECSVTIAPSALRVSAGEAVEIKGTVTCPTGLAASSRQLSVYEAQTGPQARSLAPVATAAVAADGSYSFTSKALEANTLFRVHVGRHGAHVVVKVAPHVTLGLLQPSAQPAALDAGSSSSSGATRPTRVTFGGTVDPYEAGNQVALQVSYASAARWHTIAYARVAGDGSYSITHRFRTPGANLLRAVAHAGKHKVAAVSEVVSYEAAQPQNPKLTIGVSADPLTSGEQVTITGVAAGAAGQTVTLLARTPGKPIATVATAITDGEGKYTFTDTPLQNTYYHVSGAGTSSTTLFEGVRPALAPDAAPSTVKAGEQVVFSGTLTVPAGTARTVNLEREGKYGVGYQTVASAATGSASSYAITYVFAHPGSYTMRIGVPGDGLNLATAGEPFTIVVTE